MTHKFRSITLILLAYISFTSCKKNTIVDKNVEKIVSPITGTRTEFTLDSIYLYAKQIYLWNDVIPYYSDFAPRTKYTFTYPELNAFRKELFDISQLKLNQVTGKPYELSSYNNLPKYSFLQLGRTVGGAVRAGVVNGEAILGKNIIHSADKTIAYVALGSFPSLANTKLKLDQVFAEIAIEKPKYLVLDLRYNGGGYVETAEYVANLIAPNKLNGKVMYSEQFNSTLQAGHANILSHQPYLDAMGKTVVYNGHMATMADVDFTEAGNTYRFNKKGELNTIQDIYIIVSGQTASASELLISCLKPYLNIKLVGERTYGKPVGFFGINIDQYTIYLSSFLIRNAQGWSDYFNGMEPDITAIGHKNPSLGDPQELCLKTAISAINGNATLNITKIASTLKVTKIKKINIDPQENQNVGLIESRLKLKY